MTSILKADTIQDAAGNNIINENANTITIGASGDTINVPSGATFNVQGTAGTGFDGRWALISTGTIPGGATYIDMDDVFSATYKNYLLVTTGIDVNTDGADLHIQVKTSGGLVSGGSDYLYSYLQRASNTDSHSGSYSTGASYFRLNSSGVGNAAEESANLFIQFYNVRSTSHYKLIFSQMTSLSTGSDALYNLGVGAVKTTTALTGIRLKSSTGNLDAGVLKVYGAND